MIFEEVAVLLFVLSSGYVIVIIIIVSFTFKTTLAGYDCSAKADGWYHDPNYCHVYWRCIHGSSEEFKCATGTVWDHRENRCNWLEHVDCSRYGKTTAEIILNTGDEDMNDNHDDNKSFLESSERKSKASRMIDDDEDSSYLTICQANSSAESFCAGRDGFYADPVYCTRYYRCAHGVDQGFECPKGTAWDEETRSCAWIEHVNCDQKKLDYSTTTTTEDTTTSIQKVDTDTMTSEPSVDPVLPPTHARDGSSGGTSAVGCQPTGSYTMADPSQCNAYFQCEKGVRVRLNCPAGQLFDAEKRQCMEYERVFCGARMVNLADKNQCINKRDGIHPDTERDCQYYFQCVSQTKTKEAKCPDDYKFSIYTGRCGPANAAPMPCGTYVLGSAPMQYNRNVGFLISFVSTTVLLAIFEL